MNGHGVDLSDDQSFAAGFPHDFFTYLRNHAPLYWHEPTNLTPDGEGFWVVSRYRDIETIVMDPKTFSSDSGGARDGGGTAIKDEPTAGKMLNQTDDPHHKRLRALVNKGFTVKAVNALEQELRTRTRSLLGQLKSGEVFDFARRVSREIPTQAICLVLGVPEEDRLKLADLVDQAIETPSTSVMASEYAKQLRRYAQEIVETKRAQPSNDILSAIVHAEFEEDGSTLSDYELRSFFALLFPAGAETTTRAISGGMLAMLENPNEWQKLRAEPQLIKTAVEEIIRWTTPSAYKRRTATCETEIHGLSIREGDKVTFWEMSANRDSTVFDSPFEFNIARSPNKHLGFGAGVHFCLGAALARLELRIVFEELVHFEHTLSLDGDPQWMPNNRLVGLKSLPVRLS